MLVSLAIDGQERGRSAFAGGYLTLALTPTGGLAAWEVVLTQLAEVHVSAIDASGVRMGEQRLDTDPANSQRPSAACNGASCAVVSDEFRVGPEIYFASWTNGVVGPERTLTPGLVAIDSSVVAADGGYAVAWQTNNVSDEIFFTRVALDGAVLGTMVNVSQDTNNSRAPTLVWSGTEYGISWFDLDLQAVRFARLDCP